MKDRGTFGLGTTLPTVLHDKLGCYGSKLWNIHTSIPISRTLTWDA